MKADMLHVTAESEIEDVRRMGLKNRVVVAPLGVNIDDSVERVECADGKKVLLRCRKIGHQNTKK